MSTQAIGMMHEGYFVGRKELTAWVQQTFDPNFHKIEELASGVVYCQIVDSVYPGNVPLGKVKFQAKTEVDFLHNFKILQTSFNKCKIDRHIEVDKLSKKSFQHNMEFAQYMKAFWDMHHQGDYDAQARLKEAGVNAPPIKQVARKAPTDKENSGPAAVSKPAAGGMSKPAARVPSAGAARSRPSTTSGPSDNNSEELAAAKKVQEELKTQMTEMKLTVDGLEKERDFYFGKLREIEILCQDIEEREDGTEIPVVKSILDILYKADDEDFAAEEEQQ